MRKRTAKFWVNLCRIQKSQNPQMSTVNPPLLQPIIHVWHIRGKVYTGISSSLHCYYVSSTLFWRDVTWIRHLIAVNINFWALCWCNFLSQSGKISDLGCKRERPPPVTNAEGRGSWSCEWLWSVCSLWHVERPRMHLHASAHFPASPFSPC